MTSHPLAQNLSSECVLSDILDTMDAQVWYLKDTETYGFVNRAHAEFFGLTKTDLEHKRLYEFLPLEEAQICIAGNRKVFQTRQSLKTQEWLDNRAGQKRLIAITKTPKFNATGAIESVVCVGTDITEQYQTQQALAESQKRLALAMDAVEHGFWDWDLNSNCVYFSPRWYAMLGYAPEELPMQFSTWENLLHPEDRNWVIPTVKAAVSRGEPYEIEFRLACKSGEWKWVRAKAKSYENDATGTPHRVVGTHEDIHDLKQTEDLLRIQRDIALCLSSRSDLTGALDRAIEQLLQIDEIDCAGVYLADDCQQTFEMVAYRGLSQPFVEQVKQFEFDSERGRVLRVRQPLYLRDSEDLPSTLDEARRQEGLQAVGIIPIYPSSWQTLAGNSAIAAFNVASHRQPFLSDKVRHALESIARGIGDAIARLKIEAALQASQTNLQTLFDSIEDFLIVTDLEGGIVHANPVVEQRLGYSRRELMQMSVLDVHPPQQRQEVAAIVADMVAGRQDRCLVPLRAKDGTCIPVDTKVKLGTWNDRPVLFGLSRDITERQRAERALQERERQLELFFSQSLDGFFFMMLDRPIPWDETVDKDAILDYTFAHQRMTKINAAMSAQYGATIEECIGRTPHDLFAHDLDRGRAVWRELFDRGRLHIETEERKLDGTPIWIEGDYICLYDDRGCITGHFGIQRDITDRKRAEAALLEERQLFVSGPTIVFKWRADALRSVEYVSQNVREQLGYAPETLTRSTWQFVESIHPSDRDRVLGEVRTRVLAGDSCFEQEYRLRRADGSYCWIYDFTTVVRQPDGTVTHFLGYIQDISDRKRAEVALHESNQRFHALLHHSPEPVSLFDRNGRYLCVNSAVAQLLGRPETEIVGRTFDDLFPPEVAATFMNRVRHLMETGIPLTVDDDLPGDDRDRVFQSVLFPIPTTEASPTIFGSIATDVTERVEIEAALRLRHRHERGLELCSQELLRGGKDAIAQAIGHLRIAADVDRVYIFENFNDPTDGLCSRQTHEAVAPGVSAQIDNPLLQRVPYRQIGLGRWVDVLETGKAICGSATAFPDAERAILEMQGIASLLMLPIHVNRQWYGCIGFDTLEARSWDEADVRLLRLAAERIGSYIERQQTHAEIRTAHQRLLSIFDGLDAPVYVSDPVTHELLYVNEATRVHFGEPGDRKCYETVQGRTSPCSLCPSEALLERERGQSQTWEHYSPINQRWYRCTGKLIQWPDGRWVHQEIGMDISDRKLAEERLRQSEAKLRQVNQKLEDYTYTVSHDLKEPIRSIRYFSEFIQQDYAGQLDEAGRDYLARIIQAAHRMAGKIDDLLVLSRIGRQDVEFQVTDIGALVEAIVGDLDKTIEQKRAIVRYPSLPTIHCQPVWFSIILQNLISNAIKYNDKPQSIVELSVRELDDRFEFGIEDNGLGIDIKYHQKVFQLFKRAHGDRSVEGSGAGLAIVRSIVEEHGGTVWIDWSEVGRGTRIKFTVSKQLK